MIERLPKKSLATRTRHPVWVQRKVSVADGEGGFVDGWANTTMAPIWAEVSPIQARQRMTYKTVGVDATHMIRLDGLIEVSEVNRIVYGTRIFEVLTVEDLQERTVEKVVTCLERR